MRAGQALALMETTGPGQQRAVAAGPGHLSSPRNPEVARDPMTCTLSPPAPRPSGAALAAAGPAFAGAEQEQGRSNCSDNDGNGS